MTIHPNNHFSRLALTLSSLLSPVLSPPTPYSPHLFSNDFQSNVASIRSSAPGVAALTGLGIECPALSSTHNFIEPVVDASTRAGLHAPFSTAGFYSPPLTIPPKRDYHPTTPTQESHHIGWHTAPSASSAAPLGSYIPLSTVDQEQRATRGSESPESSASWSFRALSAASGLSPDVLAAHLSATAEIALQLMSNSQPNTPYFGHRTEVRNNTDTKPSQTWSIPCLSTPEMTGPIADINMRQLMLSHQDMVPCVNPIDTFPGYTLDSVSLTPSPPQPEHCRSPDGSFTNGKGNDDPEDEQEPVEAPRDTDTENASNDSSSYHVDAEPALPLNVDDLEGSQIPGVVDYSAEAQTPCEEREPSEYEPSVHDCPSDLDFSPSPAPGGRSSSHRNIIRRQATFMFEHIPEIQDVWSVQPKMDVKDIDLGTPVLNAHLGITLTELQEKAERFRLRNNMLLTGTGEIDYRYDRRWLLSFVGRLSQQGEAIQEYRCYVVGCAQTNKRRDHILIHLGGHLGHRPFKCTSCPARFLRKNECKRHELSHSGERPFICDLCHAGFVRQDLWKRHMRRAHRHGETPNKRKLDGDIDISQKRPRKKTKAS